MIHVYCGDGKGKTTAALGLILRHVGAGGKAVLAAHGAVDYALAADYAVYALDGTIYAFDPAGGKTYALSAQNANAVLLAAGGNWALWRETAADGAAAYRYQDFGRDNGEG